MSMSVILWGVAGVILYGVVLWVILMLKSLVASRRRKDDCIETETGLYDFTGQTK